MGLAAMSLIAQLAIVQQGWRSGWLAIGATTLLVGFVPTWLLLARRPEDLGLLPDGIASRPAGATATLGAPAVPTEPAVSRHQALRTPSFCVLLLFPLRA